VKVNWGASVTSMALLTCIGVDEEGFREVLAVEVAGTEKGAAYASLLRGLIDRGLKGVRLVISDDHEGIKAAVSGELPGVDWQRCVVHFARNVLLAHVPAKATSEVAEELKAIFKQGQTREDSEGFGQRVCRAICQALPEGGFHLRVGDRRWADVLLKLSGLASRADTDDECAGEALQGGEEEDESDRSVPEREERGYIGHRDNLEEQ
jgi:transposase-like protein